MWQGWGRRDAHAPQRSEQVEFREWVDNSHWHLLPLAGDRRTLLGCMLWLLLPATFCCGERAQAPGLSFTLLKSSSDQCLYQRLYPTGGLGCIPSVPAAYSLFLYACPASFQKWFKDSYKIRIVLNNNNRLRVFRKQNVKLNIALLTPVFQTLTY